MKLLVEVKLSECSSYNILERTFEENPLTVLDILESFTDGKTLRTPQVLILKM